MLENRRSRFLLNEAAAVITGGRPLRFLLSLYACGIAWLPLSVCAQPAIEWAASLGNCCGFNVRFKEPVNPHTATNIAHYAIDFGTIVNVAPLHGSNLQEYVVTVAGSVPFDAQVTANGIADLASPPGFIAADTAARILPTDGVINVRYFGAVNGSAPIPGDQLADLLLATDRFPDSPDAAGSVAAIELAPGHGPGGNSGFQLVGFVVPDISGEYQFLLNAGSQAALYLSSSADPEALTLIAVEPAGNPFRDYLSDSQRLDTAFGNASFPGIAPNLAVNQSANTVGLIPLLAGHLYYFEVVMKLGEGGADHLSVAWNRVGTSGLTNGAPPVPRQHLVLAASNGAWPSATIVWTDIPELTTEGQTATMQVVAGGNSIYPLYFQWFRDGQPIPDATNHTYIIDSVTADIIGARFACRVRNDFGEDSTDPLATAGRPTLSFVSEGDQKFVTWPAEFWDFTLQSVDALEAGIEWDNPAGGVLSATEMRVPVPAGGARRFFQAMKSFPASSSPP